MGRSCILDSHPGRWMPAAVQMPAVVRMPACHKQKLQGREANGRRHRLTKLCVNPPPPRTHTYCAVAT